jgi:protein AroM
MAFVTIGQSPRLDMVPEMYADLPRVDVIERGALDGLSEAEIAALAPVDGAKSLVTRLVDGREVVLDHARTEARLAAVLEELDGEDMDAVVVLCTGTEVPPLKNSLVIEAQAVVDSLARFIETPGTTLTIKLTPLGKVPAMQLFHLLQTDPLLALSQFRLEAATAL